MDKQSLSLVMPIYKNEDNLEELFQMLVEQDGKFASLGCYFEPVFVVDGSPDNCLRMIIEAKKKNRIPKSSIIVELSRNFGQIQAINAGFSLSTGKSTICYSADMQDPPELFIKMYEAFIEGHEIVLAVRSAREDNFIQNLTSKIGYGILRREVPNIPKGGFDFFLVGQESKLHLMQRNGSRRFLQGDLINLGFSPAILHYKRSKRVKGRSSYTFKKRLAIFADAFYDSSNLPIKLSSRVGFVVASFGFFSAVYLLISYFSGKTPFDGFTALMTSILFIGGIQLMVLGVIGEYISRIFDISRNRPIYVVKSVS